jgi:hypothetical protein
MLLLADVRSNPNHWALQQSQYGHYKVSMTITYDGFNIASDNANIR